MNMPKIFTQGAFIAFMLINTQCWNAAQSRFHKLAPEELNEIADQLVDSYNARMDQNQINHANTVIAKLQTRGVALPENEKQKLRQNRIGVYLTDKQNESILNEFKQKVERISTGQTKEILTEINQKLKARCPWESYPISIVTNQN